MPIPALPPKPEAILHAGRLRSDTPDSQRLAAKPSATPRFDDSFLDGCSEDELQVLLHDPDLLEALFLARHPHPVQYAQVLEDTERKQAELRAHVEALRPEVLEKRFEVENALMKMKALERDWEDTERQMYNSMKPMSPVALQARLQAAVTDSQAMSDSMLTSFLDFGSAPNNDNIQDFIKDYRQVRKLYHLRSARLARLKEGRISGFR